MERRAQVQPTQGQADTGRSSASRLPPLVFGDPSAIAAAKIAGSGKDYKASQALRVQVGLHPTGFRLAGDAAPEDARCKNCEHHIRLRRNVRVYHKCELLPDTHGPASDIRVSWPACEQWDREIDPNDIERVE